MTVGKSGIVTGKTEFPALFRQRIAEYEGAIISSIKIKKP
jgi:hypothetical protein